MNQYALSLAVWAIQQRMNAGISGRIGKTEY